MKQTYWFSLGFVLLAWGLVACQVPETTQSTLTPAELTPAVSQITPPVVSTFTPVATAIIPVEPSPTTTLIPSPNSEEVWPFLFSGINCPSDMQECSESSLFLGQSPVIYLGFSDGQVNQLATENSIPQDIGDLRTAVFDVERTKMAYISLERQWQIFDLLTKKIIVVPQPTMSFPYQAVFSTELPNCLLFYPNLLLENRLIVEKSCEGNVQTDIIINEPLPAGINLPHPSVLLTENSSFIFVYGKNNENYWQIFTLNPEKLEEWQLIFESNNPNFIQPSVTCGPDLQICLILLRNVEGNFYNNIFYQLDIQNNKLEQKLQLTYPLEEGMPSRIAAGILSPSGAQYLFTYQNGLKPADSGLYILDFSSGEVTKILSYYLVTNLQNLTLLNEEFNHETN